MKTSAYPRFSTLWKIVFHAMEKSMPIFPRYGKLWPKFSTLWKTSFHGMENMGPRYRAGDTWLQAMTANSRNDIEMEESFEQWGAEYAAQGAASSDP